jgi:hypothetical protein
VCVCEGGNKRPKNEVDDEVNDGGVMEMTRARDEENDSEVCAHALPALAMHARRRARRGERPTHTDQLPHALSSSLSAPRQ